MLKAIIVVLLVAIILSLGSGAVFFFKDQGESKRTLYALGVRVTLAVLLVICLVYGVMTGQLTLNAPWHQ
ncbi:MAG: twin transmembrane helix small protein [Gammaproteobacteria bacterium]